MTLQVVWYVCFLPMLMGETQCCSLLNHMYIFIRIQSAFVHTAVMEGLAILRAHVAALGGNLLSCYSLDRTVVLDSPNSVSHLAANANMVAGCESVVCSTILATALPLHPLR